MVDHHLFEGPALRLRPAASLAAAPPRVSEPRERHAEFLYQKSRITPQLD